MAIVLLILSGILFISTFGIHSFILSKDKIDHPMYIYNPLLSSIPIISGFILPVIPFAIVTGFHWLAVFFANLVAVYIIGPFLTKAFLIRFASGKGLGLDMVVAFIGGIVTLVIGLIIK